MENKKTIEPPAPIPPKPEENSASTEPTPKKSKLTIILLGILVVSLIFAGTFFVSKSLRKPKISPQPPIAPQITPTPDETANWKNYIDKYLPQKQGFVPIYE